MQLSRSLAPHLETLTMHPDEVWGLCQNLFLHRPVRVAGALSIHVALTHMQVFPQFFQGLLYATGWCGVITVIVPVRHGAPHPCGIDHLQLDVWVPFWRQIPFCIGQRYFSVLVEVSGGQQLEWNGGVAWATQGRFTYGGDVLVIRHNEAGTQVLDVEEEDRVQMNHALNWCAALHSTLDVYRCSTTCRLFLHGYMPAQ